MVQPVLKNEESLLAEAFQNDKSSHYFLSSRFHSSIFALFMFT